METSPATGNSQFSWKLLYMELARKMPAWRSRQGDLIQILNDAREQGVPLAILQDLDKNGKRFPLKVMDPFTFFGAFNRKTKSEHRLALLALIKEKFRLNSLLPSDFEALPVMNPQNSWFFSYEKDREPDAIDTLWDFAVAIINTPAEAVPAELFKRCLNIRCVGLGSLTMGLFWMRPDQYVAIDRQNRTFLQREGFDTEVSDWGSYLALLQNVKQHFPGKTSEELSKMAYLEGKKDQRYWLFQANPNYFDLVGALTAGALRTWQVNQHRKEIQEGDRVVLWLSGANAGVYGLATVASDVKEQQEDSAEAAFQKQPGNGESFVGVTLNVNRAFCDSPITREALMENKETKDAPVGRQGTNFSLTQKQFDAIEMLAPSANPGRRYWLYAPGDNARFWDECQARDIMLLGFEGLGDLRQYKSLQELQTKLKKLKNMKEVPVNDALAAWEFLHVLKPGDVVIAKRGRRDYLGYGIVDGLYQRDDSLPEYRNFRKARWIKSGEWQETEHPIVVKTLTDITKFPDYVKRLRELIGIDETATPAARDPMLLPARNIILYGPPGTGKTFRLRNEYMERFTERHTSVSPEERASALVKDLSWWEVVALALLDTPGNSAFVAQILEHPLVRTRLSLSANKNPGAMLWGTLQSHTKNDCQWVKYSKRIEPLLFSKDDNSLWSIDVTLAAQEVPELSKLLEEFKNPTKQAPEIKRYRFTTFHQSFSYEDFVEGIKPQVNENSDGQVAYEIRNGVFKDICREAANSNKNFAIFIDEINRGNVASIFGELITLIEEDKRLDGKNKLTATLPYSREEFGVPGNLFIIGTMNTADRSVEALDTALRRRFTFIEMRPDREQIKQPSGLNVELRQLFDVINARIEQLLDHEHCIGHAYFMEIKNLSDLRCVFANKVMPLLREYFYGNPAKVGMVLGERFVKRKGERTAFASGNWGMDDLDEKDVYQFVDILHLSSDDFASIYATSGTGI
jgi:predicted RNA-binding protein with PUA-like domain